MKFEYKEISLKDAVSFVVDNRGKTVPIQESGIPLIATANISNENLYPSIETDRYVSKEVYFNWFRSHPKAEDIILTNKGSKNGAVCFVPNPVDFCIAQDMVALRANKQIIDPKYLFASLRSKLVQKRIKSLNVDAVIPHFKKTDFDKLFIPLPSLEVQKFIGHLYHDLSIKIELNKKTNETLEDIAKALFKSWFIDFDPVRAKAEGRSTGFLDEISNLFPSSFEDSKLGHIPTGWEVAQLADIVKNISRGISPKYTDQEEYPVINQKCIRNSQVNFSLCKFTDYKKNMESKFLSRFDVLVNSMGVGTLGRVALFINYNKNILVDGCVSFIRGKTEDYSLYIYQNLSLREKEIINLSTGSTGQTSLSKDSLLNMEFIKPGEKILERFSYLIKDFYIQRNKNIIQNNYLMSLRDTLLPKLISGELKIPDAEKMIDEVGI